MGPYEQAWKADGRQDGERRPAVARIVPSAGSSTSPARPCPAGASGPAKTPNHPMLLCDVGPSCCPPAHSSAAPRGCVLFDRRRAHSPRAIPPLHTANARARNRATADDDFQHAELSTPGQIPSVRPLPVCHPTRKAPPSPPLVSGKTTGSVQHLLRSHCPPWPVPAVRRGPAPAPRACSPAAGRRGKARTLPCVSGAAQRSCPKISRNRLCGFSLARQSRRRASGQNRCPCLTGRCSRTTRQRSYVRWEVGPGPAQSWDPDSSPTLPDAHALSSETPRFVWPSPHVWSTRSSEQNGCDEAGCESPKRQTVNIRSPTDGYKPTTRPKPCAYSSIGCSGSDPASHGFAGSWSAAAEVRRGARDSAEESLA